MIVYYIIRGDVAAHKKRLVKMIEINKIYNDDCANIADEIEKLDVCIVTDPPFNIGYHYDKYKDVLNEKEYYCFLRRIINFKPAAIVHYSEFLHKLSMFMFRAPEKVVTWVYNSNTPRQHRDIAFYGVKPDFYKVDQPYKNLNDKRIKERIKAGKKCRSYDWFECDQIKNVEKKKMSIDHPCVMPLDVMDKIIKMIPENYIIYDPFCGSGTTLIAAINNNRKFIGCEISKKYFELAQRRINEETLQTKLF